MLPQLLFHMSTTDTAPGHLESVKHDDMTLNTMFKGFGAQVIFFSVLLVRGKGLRREQTLQVENCCATGVGNGFL